MFKDEDKNQLPSANRKTYSRSVSWSDRSPRKSNCRPQWNSKARACLPPLHPLSITRPSIEEWPRAGSDDLGIWPNLSTPCARLGSMAPHENMSLDQPPREFEFKKDKLAFFDKECSRILDHIYLGCDAIAKSREILQRNGITHVLNCVGFVCPEYFKNELVYKTLWLRDSPSEDITSILYDVFDYFEDVREQGGRVLVHCCQGVSRSTSLVIAYLMWKEGQSFEDAFQHVKAARGVTNPNMGFACQLLLCQKRVHAQPASPTSVLRMYRMAPHSPYDPLHLVPKMLIEPGANRLDSRGAFIIQIPSAIFVWTGKHCFSVMLDNATAAASQVIRYERAQGPIKTIKEGEETSELWDALGYEKQLADESSPKVDTIASSSHQCVGQRKVDEYNIDFEIFQKALSGGVVPPFPLSGAESETCLPARENGWSRLRRKFSSGVVKEFISSSRLNYNTTQTCDDLDMIESCKDVEDCVAPADLSMPSSPQCDSPDSFASYATSSLGWMKTNFKEVECSACPTDTSLSPSPSFSSLDSFTSFLVNKQMSSSTSPSLSPSTSDYSSSFTFSPSSSNWSDLSYFSALTSPSGLEYKDPHLDRGGSAEESECLLHKVTSPPPEEAFSAGSTLRATGSCLSFKERSLSIAERRGNIRPPRMMLPSVDEVSQIPENSSNSLPCIEDDIMRDVECSTSRHNDSFEMDREEPLSDSDDQTTEYELPSRSQDDRMCNTFDLMSNDMTNRIAQPTDLLFYQWPSMDKMDTHCVILDSRSIYIILVPSVSSEGENANILYMWVGHEVSQNGGHDQSIDDGKCKNSPAHLENVCRSFLAEKGFDTNAQIKMVEEGQEPAQLLELLSSLRKNLNS
ncbi:protein-tyrosine-phosphatase MKP1-like [Olea europaea var. sylvestris]|uniref:protein-tyrosine-phosphatase MKP1-like n=1 Tax=Olea europaea var. sylvestris TaxID=158386 RepID=UPI000C1CEFEB|nr:protein-tyrosine-phosphatase MKP1-like [Olea europaea var. sylvestris]XP_022878271.1 protein-tyrosine-phosphatase MKP1-like [Olea europaea var. sylvestris]XP_022878272.1 protein-tyrosine-phosphatase MKP1-like [Olea europaea var. sylvestris]XP_022878273.1 protein-tyrosine-phosphatase MKP1-like [Olea europaea var. sylvestris]